ncbi:hypothetical protein [Stutzerimonas stutzeri]|uniref:hypothetical protein n=1 Tax=Stutzerimonas stutzeri TaxID=316 RepID=UPI003B783E11
MHLLLSGEGPGDIGACYPAADHCTAEQFQPGPMAWFVDQLVEGFQGFEFSHVTGTCVTYLSKSYLAANKPARLGKGMSISGKKSPKETHYYYANARALAIAAKDKAASLGDAVIAVLFRDGDGTASAERGQWRDKHQSMIAGFQAEAFELGVPMIPKPKSEAWLLCAVKANPYQHCNQLESESGNDRGVNPLKAQLEAALAAANSTQQLNQRVISREIDAQRIDMDSFNEFKNALQRAVHQAMRQKIEPA